MSGQNERTTSSWLRGKDPNMTLAAFIFIFFVGYRGIDHLPSGDGGTERTWFLHHSGCFSEPVVP